MITIDKMSRKPIYEQVIDGIEREIISGEARGGAQIPSVRELSGVLAINPNTIQRAYAELDRRKVIKTVPARGAFVSENALEIIQNRQLGLLDELRVQISRLKLVGVDKQTLIELIDNVFDGGVAND